MSIIIFDFEVFKFDTLLGALIINENNTTTIYQTWSIEEIKKFYFEHIDDIWVGWNNENYDNFILQACVKGQNVKEINDDIIIRDRRQHLNMKLIYYDLMKPLGYFSLKVTEALAGKKISESEIDFNLNRVLTKEEKLKIESYNYDDLEQTLYNFYSSFDSFSLQLETISEFNLDLSLLPCTGTMLAEKVLHASRINGISSMIVKPKKYENLQIKNQEVLNYYLNEQFIDGKKLKLDLCGVPHTIGVGGIHGAQKKCQFKKALYFDVSGYYNLIMINYNLLPRSIPEEYKKVYTNMYYEQLKLKKTNPKKRAILKTILLTVFGAMLNEYTAFYDPYHGRLVTLTGQLFLVDLLEKLEGFVELVQSNTDGIILVPLASEEKVISIVNEWQTRTGFNVKIEHLENIIQRDVNCYMYKKDGEINSVGGDIKEYSRKTSYSSKREPDIVIKAAVEYFMLNKFPEEIIEENKNNIKLFQYISKKGSFKYMQLEETNINTSHTKISLTQNVNRVFASNDKVTNRMLYKRNDYGKVTKAKVSNLPDNIFIYNDEILSKEINEKLSKNIDYEYYVQRSYKIIKEFLNLPEIKKLKL